LASSRVADDALDRPLLTEMAEKMRQARSTSFTDRPEPAPPAPAAPPARPEPQHQSGGRDPSPGPDPLQVSLRIDSLERRLFELRAALEDATAQAAGPVPDVAPGVAPGDAAAWIAFAAAAMREYDDAATQAEAADQLLAEYRARRAGGGVLGDEV
jgi:hypothetical protein